MKAGNIAYLISVCILLNACGSTGDQYVSPLEYFVTGCREHYDTFLPVPDSDSIEVYWYSYKDGRPYEPPEKQMIYPIDTHLIAYYPLGITLWDSLIIVKLCYGIGLRSFQGAAYHSVVVVDSAYRDFDQLLIMGNHRTQEVFGIYPYFDCPMSQKLEDFLLFESKEKWDGFDDPIYWKSAIRQWEKVRKDSAAGTRLDSLKFHDWDCEKIREAVTRLVEQESK